MRDVRNLDNRLLTRILPAAEHVSAAMTLNVYSHVLPHMQDEAAARVEALLLGESQTTWHTIGTQQPINDSAKVV